MISKRKVRLAVSHVGCAETTAFARRHHPTFDLPAEEIFAVALNHDTADVVYGLVSERDKSLEVDGQKEAGCLGVNSVYLEEFERAIRREALECGVKAPISITMVTKRGICSTPVLRLRRPVQKGAA